MKKSGKVERPKDQKVQLRLAEFDKNRIKILAKRYAGGNMSLWMTFGALNAPRKFLVKPPKTN